ncbi:hypothetical protein I4U23_028612 [Adineta vaga]|nr:hypothetical protein I4U23_028612 [Adineta vaga]
MMQHRSKLHPSSCFPPNPSVSTTKNRLFIRNSPIQTRPYCAQMTFIGINQTTYSSIAALLVHRPSTSIESIKVFDICLKEDVRTILHDLQVTAVLNRNNVRLERVYSYWETKDSIIIIINVQHHQLEHESTWTWIQVNASLVESVVSQVCIYSPHATLIVCTQPNELMTYVASCVSKFPIGRVFGLGASIDTAYAHRTTLEQMGNIHGHVNGFSIVGNGLDCDACTTILADHLTVDGISCSDIYSKTDINKIAKPCSENQLVVSRKQESEEWNLIKILKNKETLYTNVQRRLPFITDLFFRQKIVARYLILPNLPSTSKFNRIESLKTSIHSKLRSHWTKAMIIVRITRALLNNCEFQSNFVVNISPIHNSKNIFINYPTIIGSTNRSIEYMFPFHQAQSILQQRTFLIPYEKLQTKLYPFKSTY